MDCYSEELQCVSTEYPRSPAQGDLAGDKLRWRDSNPRSLEVNKLSRQWVAWEQTLIVRLLHRYRQDNELRGGDQVEVVVADTNQRQAVIQLMRAKCHALQVVRHEDQVRLHIQK